MQFEVEQKHGIADPAALVARLMQRGVEVGPPIEQLDQYFAHPCRDFAQTDEALRIRTVGRHSYVTYKGPKLDSATKTRRELELPLDASDGDGRQFVELLRALHFTPVATVQKNRQPFRFRYEGRDVEGAVDVVAHLGSFVELELVCGREQLEEAQRVVAALAAELKLGPVERRSYLEMLLQQAPVRTN